MRFHLLTALFVCVGSATAQPLADTLVLALPGGKDRLRIELATPGELPAKRWHAFLDRWFAYFDTDGDGKLTPKEAAKIFPLPIPARMVPFDFKRADTNGDGAVTPDELIAYYETSGFTAVLAVVEPVSLRNAQIAEALFRHLGPDKSGTLTLEHFKRAPDLLRKLDENEDEVLTPEEVLSAGVDPRLTTPGRSEFQWRRGGQTRDPVVHLKFAADGAPLGIEAAGAGLTMLCAPNAPVRIRHPSALLAFALSDIDPGKAAANSRQFVMAQFKSVVGKTAAIQKHQVADDPSLQLLADIFPHADRNGDGNLTGQELDAFLGLLEQGVRCQTLVTLIDHGGNLFLHLDANGDGRLDFRELNGAAIQVAALGGAGGWTRAQVPHCAHVRVQLGFAAESFGPLPLAIPARAVIAAPSKRSGKGPAWFQAMDKNGDGFLSPREFLGPIELFRRLDRNGDGVISVAEAEQFGKP